MKPAVDFPTNARNADGLDSRCKPCCAARSRAWRHGNPEAARASEMRWQKKNPDKVKVTRDRANLKFRRANPEAWGESARRWREKNPERVKLNVARHAKENPVLYAVKAAARRAQTKSATPPWLTAEQRREIAALYHEARRRTLETGEPHCVDHIVPLQNPAVCGLHVPWNLRVITRRENQRKWSRLDDALLSETKP